MDIRQIELARRCLLGAEDNTMTFPAVVGALMEGGFEGYSIDFRRGAATYYLPDGDSLLLETRHGHGPVAAALDIGVIKAAIREAQDLMPGYSYAGFCAKVTAGGCAGYVVSFSGRRVLYYGRKAETHVEHFPQ